MFSHDAGQRMVGCIIETYMYSPLMLLCWLHNSNTAQLGGSGWKASISHGISEMCTGCGPDSMYVVLWYQVQNTVRPLQISYHRTLTQIQQKDKILWDCSFLGNLSWWEIPWVFQPSQVVWQHKSGVGLCAIWDLKQNWWNNQILSLGFIRFIWHQQAQVLGSALDVRHWTGTAMPPPPLLPG